MPTKEPQNSVPISLFYSYAHEDEVLRDTLEKHLSLLRRQGIIAAWYDRQILAGDEWARDIDAHLETASIILLLISPDFLASDYCYGIEMRRALERHKAGQARVIPLLVRPVDWESAPFAHLQCLPRDGKAVTQWSNQDEAFVDVAKGIRVALAELSRPRVQTAAGSSDVNRQRMLDRVSSTWISGVLDHSLHGATLIALGLDEQREVLANPWRLVVQEVDVPARPLPNGTRICEVYEQSRGSLLILGEPGSGKTTLLLELTRDLLERAQSHHEDPIPVVFNLPSWAKKPAPLEDWLVEELTVRYEVPRRLGRSWVEDEQLLLLLDGLDEVALSARRECIAAINRYRQAHQQVPIVVCSRTTEYREQATQLCLHTAVVIQPLSDEQIEQYLHSAGEQAEAVRVALSSDGDLQELASTPLMLNVLLLAYQESEIVAEGTREAKQQQVFAAYVQRMLTRRGAATRYTPEQTVQWLTSLARQMKQQGQTVFYIEQMQPDWLAHARLHRAYERWGVRLPGILIGGLLGLVVNAFFFLAVRTEDDILGGFIGGLVGGLLSGCNTASPFTENKRGSWRSRWHRLIPLGSLRNGLLVGLGVGLSRVWLVPGSTLNDGLIYGSIFGLSSVLLSVTVVPGNADRRETEPRVGAWRSLIQAGHLRNGFVVGGLVGLSFGLSFGLSYGLRYGLSFGLSYGLSFGLSFGLSYGLIGLLLSVLLRGRSRTIQLTEVIVWSWRSLWRSLLQAEHLRNALMLGGLVGLSFGLSNLMSFGLSIGLRYGLTVGLSYWLLFGLIHGLSGTILDASRRVKPNEGIRRSARNCLLLGLISGCVTALIFVMNLILSNGLINGLSFGLINGLINGLRYELFYGLSLGLSIEVSIGLAGGLLMGLLNGGLACLRHGVLRWLLWRAGSIPWNYPRFLDYAAERILLRKVGAAISFCIVCYWTILLGRRCE